MADSEVTDQSKIEADLKDGVIRSRLPRAQPANPHKVSVKAQYVPCQDKAVVFSE